MGMQKFVRGNLVLTPSGETAQVIAVPAPWAAEVYVVEFADRRRSQFHATHLEHATRPHVSLLN